jgi:predicted AAA+ superfamily ATPase
MYDRLIFKKIAKSSKSILLLGPRQVGKSTLIRGLNPDLTINLAIEQEFFSFQENRAELEERIAATQPKTVFVDEIQRIPWLMNSIQAVVDNNPKIKFYLTGSSARKLRKGRANLLPGRIFSYQLAPLCLAEVGSSWEKQKMVQFGSLPGVMSLKTEMDKKKLLQSYANTYLKEEIMAESLIRGIDGFVRFLRQAAISSGQYLDFSKMARAAKVPRQSVIRHFEVLEDTLIASRIENDPDLDPEIFDLIKHPRFYFFDLGVANALRGSFDLSGDRIGGLWEHFVYNQLVNSSQARDSDLKLFNFRTRGGLEVDFIASHQSKKFAIECKSSTHVDDHDLRPLSSIDHYYPSKITKILIYRGQTERKRDGIWIVPLHRALSILGL